jgi:hypothetical protein
MQLETHALAARNRSPASVVGTPYYAGFLAANLAVHGTFGPVCEYQRA